MSVRRTSDFLEIDRAVLGPRSGVRDYTLLGASLVLTGEERGALVAFLLSTRGFMQAGDNFTAFFAMGGSTEGSRWALARCTARPHVEGVQIVAEALILDTQDLDTLQWSVHRCLDAWPASGDPLQTPEAPARLNERDLQRSYRSVIASSQLPAWKKCVQSALSSRPTPVVVEVDASVDVLNACKAIWEQSGVGLRRQLSFCTSPQLPSPSDEPFAVTFARRGALSLVGRRLCKFSPPDGLLVDAALRREWDGRLWAFENESGLADQDVSLWEAATEAASFEQALRLTFRKGCRSGDAAAELARFATIGSMLGRSENWADADMEAFSRAIVSEFEAALSGEPEVAAGELARYLDVIEPALSTFLPSAFPTRIAIDRGTLLWLPERHISAIVDRLVERQQGIGQLAGLFSGGFSGSVMGRHWLARRVTDVSGSGRPDLTPVAVAMLTWFATHGDARSDEWAAPLSRAMAQARQLDVVAAVASHIHAGNVRHAESGIVLSGLLAVTERFVQFVYRSDVLDGEQLSAALAVENARTAINRRDQHHG